MRVSLLAVHAEQPLVPQVADARGELQAQQVEQGEDDLGIAGRVGRVLQDRQLGLVVEDLVEDVGRVPHRGGDDLGAVLGELVRGPGVEGHPFAVAEVPRQGRGHPHLAGDGEPLAVGRGQRAGAPEPAQWLVVLEVDEPRRRGLQGLVADVPVRAPGQLLVGQVGDPCHADRAEVARLGEDRRIEMAPEFAAPRLCPAGVLEVVAEARPAVDLDEQLAQLDQRQPLVDESFQLRPCSPACLPPPRVRPPGRRLPCGRPRPWRARPRPGPGARSTPPLARAGDPFRLPGPGSPDTPRPGGRAIPPGGSDRSRGRRSGGSPPATRPPPAGPPAAPTARTARSSDGVSSGRGCR